MKYVTLLLFLMPLFLFSQKTYAPLGTVWNYEGHVIDCRGYHMQYKVESEIDIDGKDCSVLYSYLATDFDTEFRKQGDSLIIWENENKVYFLEHQEFYLLYDFTAEVGDTITYYDPRDKGIFSSTILYFPTSGPNELQLVVTEITTKTIESEERKFFNTKSLNLTDSICSEQWTIIENIGSTAQGLTGHWCFRVLEGCFGGLQCYDNGSIEYITTATFETPNPACGIIDSNIDVFSNSAIEIYPNPANDFLNIDTDLKYDRIIMSDLNGKTLRTFEPSQQIKIDGVTPGFYFLSFMSPQGSKCIKIIVE